MSRHTAFQVEGKPFFALGGQVQNANAYQMVDLDVAFDVVRSFGGNSIAIPIYWEKIEPAEGQFDFSIVGDILERCRTEGLRAILLWFGSWKNGTMKYTPVWVKKNPQRFRRVMTPSGDATSVLSTHCAENFEADRKAFVRLMGYIKDKDEAEGTVIGVQVENEPGIIGGTVRDFSPEGDAAMREPVPEKLLAYLEQRPDSEATAAWRAAGGKRGDWETVFGDYGSLFMQTWSMANYIDGVAAAGKAVYDLPLYTNVWNDKGGWDIGGVSFPSGGAATRVLDLWKCACEAIDFLSPDIYCGDKESYEYYMRAFTREDNPLYIPESQCYGPGPNVRGIFTAIAECNSIGHHVFGVEGMVDNSGDLRPDRLPIYKSLRMVSDALPLIQAYQGTPAMTAVTQNDFQLCTYRVFGDWVALIEFGKPDSPYPGTDYLHLDDVNGPDDPGRGFIFQVGPDEFYIVGDALRVHFAPKPRGGRISPILSTNAINTRSVNYALLTEGRFDEQGHYEVDRRRSGDENDFGVWASWDVGVIHCILTE